MRQRFWTILLAVAASVATVSCGDGGSGSSTGGSGTTGGTGGTAGSGGAGGTTTSSGGTGGQTASPYNPLWIPEMITGTTFDLTLAESTKQLRDGQPTTTYGYNGHDFWGPTLVMNKGDVVQMNVTNSLSEETTTHWHGFHIPAMMDGGPHQVVAAGATWSPSFEVKNDAATYWYHPHLHMTTMEQLIHGAGGLIIVKDPQEAALPLPRTYGVDDVPLVLTSRRFSADNQLDTTAVYGDYMLTNGTLDAEVALPAQVVRLRILNADIERAYDLGFEDGRTFYQITTDDGLVNTPVPLTKLKMFVGERAEILVDLSKDAPGSELVLQSFNGGQPFGFPGGEEAQSGQFGSLLNNKTFDVLHVKVAEKTAGAIESIPAKLADNVYWTEADVTNSRTITITGGTPGTPFTFDNKAYDMDVINQTVSLNAVEKWTIVNSQVFGHSFHIHDVQFKILSRSSGTVGDYEQGWKDVVAVPRNESVTFIAKFADFASDTDPYMYHCHFANHEDGGMMGQFLVK